MSKVETYMRFQQKTGFTAAACAIAMLLIAAGLSLVVAIVALANRKIPETPELEPFQLALQWAQDAQRDGEVEEAFDYLGQAIDRARNVQERNKAVIAMIAFLLDEPRSWRDMTQRRRMAAEYILALVESGEFPEQEHARLTNWSFDIAEYLKETTMLETAEKIMQQTQPNTELLLAAFDAYHALDLPQKALQTLIRLKNQDLSNRQREEFLYRRLLCLQLAQHNPQWLQAGGKRYQSLTPQERPGWMRARLESEAQNLQDSNRPQHMFAARMAIADLAIEQERWKDAIRHLRMAVKIISAKGRKEAATKLLALLRKTGQHREANESRDELMLDTDTMQAAFEDLMNQFQVAQSKSEKNALLQTIDVIIGFNHATIPDPDRLLIRAAYTAFELEQPDRVKRYMQHDEKFDLRKQRSAERQLLQAKVYGLENKPRLKIKQLHALLSSHPPEDVDREARFLLFDTLAENPTATIDLTGTVVGIAVRYPNDVRIVEKLLLTAKRLEEASLFPAAEVYYRQAALLGTLHTHRKAIDPSLPARAMLGQARVLMETDRMVEADQLLRTINAQKRWSAVWPEAGPLWASIAMQQQQPREALRRWRQTSGPPAGALIPMLFQILIPEIDEVKALPGNLVRQPAQPPPESMVLAASDAAINKLLADNQYDQITELLQTIEKDAQWSKHMPTKTYRVMVLEHMLARENIATVKKWIAAHGIQNAKQQGTLLPPNELLSKLTELEAITQQAKKMVF